MSVTVFNPRIDDAAASDIAAVTALNELSSAQAPVKAANKKVFITTQGCQMNVYDSGKMLDVLGDSHGMEVTHNIDEADVLLMNTCSIREKAQEKVFSELGRWRKLKEKRPDLVIGVGGCVASQEGDNIQKRAPYVDMVFGPQTLHRLPELYDQSHEQREIAPKNRIGTVDVSFPSIEKFDFLPEPRVEGFKAFVSIMEGCSKYCSFCVVPYTRGEELSRPLDDVLAEIDSLAAQGVREINLLGQNVNGYRGEKDDGSICRFAELLHYVSHVDGVERIRYTTSHPLEFTDDIIDAYAQLPELVSHL
ncbi:MAG TPA: tRNA (N6-isopentenyl adenosine(37)-C2)-methylthiotransferase MiaB, partial [Psychrobacter sp.]|nr:tRNA (N6-isopentenyl adenosine(37)-C2)-methylthiotransferase MiaB [Psychrobacter sp.]